MQATAAVVILATASGPLLWTPVAGRITLARTIDIFDASPYIHTIILVLDAERIPDATTLCKEEGWHKIAAILIGTTSRQASVHIALDTLATSTSNSDWVMIHDGARPLVTPAILEVGLQAALAHHAATAAVPVKDTIKQGQQGQVSTTLDRSQLWAVQTPQVFSYPLIHQAHHQSSTEEEVTDDAALVEQLGQRIVIFPGSYSNIKITTPEDVLLAEALIQGLTNL